MNNSSKNYPANVQMEKEELTVLVTNRLTILGSVIEFEEFSSGYLGITNPAFDGIVAGVERFHYTNHARGLFTGIQSLVDNKNGYYVHGLHLPEGKDFLKFVRDEKKDYRGRSVPRGYVNWDDLLNPLFAEENAADIAFLAGFGITPRDEDRGYWLALGAKDQRLFPLWVNKPLSWDEFVAYMGENHPEIEQGTPEWKQKVEDIFDRGWNISHKHEGIQAALQVVWGNSRIGVEFRPFRTDSNPERTLADWDKMMAKHYLGLFKETTEDRRARQAREEEEGNARRGLRTQVIRATNPDYVRSPLVKEPKKGGTRVQIYAAPGELKDVAASELVGKSFQIVYGNGTPIKGATLPMPTEDYVLGAIDMATALHGLVRVTEA